MVGVIVLRYQDLGGNFRQFFWGCLGRAWQQYPAVLKFCRLGIETYQFVRTRRRIIGSYMKHPFRLQILNQLGSRRFALYKNCIGGLKVCVFSLSLVLYRTFQIGVIETLAKYVQQIVKAVKDAPRSANAKIIEIAALVGSIPALQH